MDPEPKLSVLEIHDATVYAWCESCVIFFTQQDWKGIQSKSASLNFKLRNASNWFWTKNWLKSHLKQNYNNFKQELIQNILN